MVTFLVYCLIGCSTEATIPAILSFITGQTILPPLGVPEPIQIQLQSDYPLPTAERCFNLLRLLVCHTEKRTFYEAVDKAVLYSFGYYGLS